MWPPATAPGAYVDLAAASPGPEPSSPAPGVAGGVDAAGVVTAGAQVGERQAAGYRDRGVFVRLALVAVANLPVGVGAPAPGCCRWCRCRTCGLSRRPGGEGVAASHRDGCVLVGLVVVAVADLPVVVVAPAPGLAGGVDAARVVAAGGQGGEVSRLPRRRGRTCWPGRRYRRRPARSRRSPSTRRCRWCRCRRCGSRRRSGR